MFSRRKAAIDARLDRLEEAISKLAEAISRPAPPVEPVGQLLAGFGAAIASLADSTARSNEHVSKITGDLLDRASSQALRQLRSTLGKQGQEAKKAKAEIAKTFPPFAAGCEECLALIQQRAARHENDLMRHGLEKHAEQLAIFSRQQGLDFEVGH